MGRRRWFTGLIASVALLAAACGDGSLEVDPIDEVEEPAEPGLDTEPEPEPDPEPDPDPVDEQPADPEPSDVAGDPQAADDELGGAAGDDPDASNEDVGLDVVAQPDPARVSDPCAEHPDGEMTSFIDVVSPVDGQTVRDEVALVGCANVFEGNVEWWVVDGDGALLTTGFTTADCSMTCNGVFEAVVSLEAGEPGSTVTLEVFSSNMADEGPDRLQEVAVTLHVE